MTRPTASTSADTVPSAMTLDLTGETMLTTEADLRTYLDTHAERHQPAESDAEACSCGWPHLSPTLLAAFRRSGCFHNQAEHAQDVLIGDLGNLLPSDRDIRREDGTRIPVAWRPHARDLQQQLADRDATLDPRFLALLTWCHDKGHDLLDLAEAATLNPRYLAQLLDQTTPTPEPQPAPQEGRHP